MKFLLDVCAASRALRTLLTNAMREGALIVVTRWWVCIRFVVRDSGGRGSH
jgi:hypothetical protein